MHEIWGIRCNTLKNKRYGLAMPLLFAVSVWEDQSVIVVILGIAVLGLFVISLTSSLFGNRRERS